MPSLDVSFVLGLPFFADDTGTLYVKRTARETGNNGRALPPTTPPQVPLDGVVQPASPTQLKMLPEGARAEGVIAVYTRFRLYPLGGDQAPDEVEWKGQTYTVTAVKDWTDYGAGYCLALCTLKDFAETEIV